MSQRTHLRLAARRGNRAAIQTLRNPHPFPESLRYLYEWSQELYGRSGISEHGVVNPLSWQTLDAWARRTGREPLPHEVDALYALDSVMRFPGTR